MPLPTLLWSIPFSPWSERARWALDATGVQVAKRTYASLVHEPWVRWSTRRWTGRITMPLLVFSDGSSIMDSEQIARWADQHTGAGRLFPDAHAAELTTLQAEADRLLELGRVRTTLLVRDAPESHVEMVPRGLSRLPGPLVHGVASLGCAYLLRKYAIGVDTVEQCEAAMATIVDRWGAHAQGLAEGEPWFGELSWADLLVATGVQFVQPHSGRFMPVGRRSRPLWTATAVADQAQTLLRWRDSIYAAHRAVT